MLRGTMHRATTSSPRHPFVICCLLTLVTTAPLRAGDPAEFHDAGAFLQTASFASDPFDVSADGTYVVGDNRSPGISMGFRWSEALGWESLGSLPGGAANSGAWACSADGATVVGTSSSSLNPNTEAFVWTPGGGIVGLGDLGCGNSNAYDVTDDGTLVVGHLASTCGVGASFYWSPNSGMVQVNGLVVTAVAGGGTQPPLPPAVPGDFATLYGQIPFAGPTASHVARWTPGGGVESLGFVGIPNRATPGGGVVVGSHTTSSGHIHAFRWSTTGGLQDLGTLSGNGSEATGVSADGEVVVGWSTSTLGTRRAFVWDAAHGMRDLQTVLTEDHGLDLTGWNLFQALGISADGRTLVGTGRSPPPASDRVWVARLGEPMGQWTDLGGGSVGVAGQPTLTGSGPLSGGSTASVSLTDAPSGAALLAWISFAPTPFAALGGTVHAFPFASQLFVFADAAGEFDASTTWPAGVPVDTEVSFQFIVQDASVPDGLTLSNGVLATTP